MQTAARQARAGRVGLRVGGGPLSAVVLAALLMTAGCGGGSGATGAKGGTAGGSPGQQAAGGPAPVTASIKLSYGAPSGAFLPFWVAQDKGLFRQYGLQTQLEYTAGTVGDNALIAGDVQAFDTGTSVMNAISKGAPLEYISEDLPYFMFYLEAKPDIHRFSDLVGKTVAITEPSAADGSALRQLAEQQGVPLSKIHVLSAHSVPAALTALVSGQVDAAVLSVPSSVRAERAGDHPVADMLALKLASLYGGVAVRRDWASAHPETVLALLKAYTEAIRFVRDNPKETMAVIAHYLKLSDQGLIQATYDRYAKAFEPIPEVSEQSFLSTMRVMGISGDVKTFYDNSYLEQLKAQGFFKQLYPNGIPTAAGGAAS